MLLRVFVNWKGRGEMKTRWRWKWGGGGVGENRKQYCCRRAMAVKLLKEVKKQMLQGPLLVALSVTHGFKCL